MTDLFTEIQAELEQDPAQLARLQRNRAWLALVVASRTKQALMKERLVRSMLRKNAEPVDQRQVDYTRGVIDTIDFFLGLPEAMQKRIDAGR